MNSNGKRIMVVDDHPATRMGLLHAMEAQPDLRVCAEAGTVKDARRLALEQRPDLMILDLNLKDGHGLDLVKELGSMNALPPTLVVSILDENIYAPRLLQAGAKGYLMKEEPMDAVLAAVRKVLAGHIAVSSAIASRIIRLAAGQPEPADEPGANEMTELSNRELQVFEMIGEGLNSKQIAARLDVSEKTVSTYKTRIMDKFQLSNTPDLIAEARRRTVGALRRPGLHPANV